MQSSRREVLVGGASLAALASLPVARAAPSAVRYSATSSEGKKMLAKYATAVTIMKNLPAQDPRNWDFQWFSHWIPGPNPMNQWAASEAVKQAALLLTFGGTQSAQRQLAVEMWNKCQTHGDDPSNPSAFEITYFLPWHRWFVYYFEKIVQSVLGDPSFTLPYWDYLGDTDDSRKIPPEFLDRNSSLYIPIRNSWVNQGEPIDKNSPGALNFEASSLGYYVDDAGETGFCPSINQNPHGLVHDFTGDVANMGYVPTAAQDPVFWLHHSNVDRLWASWNAAGYANPTWEKRVFVFADGDGNRVEVDPNGASSTQQLGYTFDTFQKVDPSLPITEKTKKALGSTAQRAQFGATGSVALSSTAPASVPLQPLPSAPSLLASGQRMLASAPKGGSSVFLVLSGVNFPEPVNGTYKVFLNLPEGAPATTASPSYVGSFGSFDTGGHAHHGAGRRLVLNATRTLARLSAGKAKLGPLRVTFVPAGPIKTPPTIESVSLLSN